MWSHTQPSRHLRIAVVVGLLCLASVMPSSALGLAGSDVARDLPSLGIWGPVAIIALRFFASLIGILPTSPLLLAAGATEGVVLGSIYVLIGAQLGALAGFLIGRRFGRDFVARRGWLERAEQTRIGHWLLADDTPQTQLMAAVFISRLVPGLNMDAFSYVAGVTPLSIWRFCLASLAALLPYTVLLVAAGQQLVILGSGTLAAAVVATLGFTALVVVCRKHWPRALNRA